ncbi:MAG: hypothetical protein MI975_14045 [Cytophagales bacterium]|nr:hypothetical protein [Cytophagales bacterium]
MKYSSSVKQFYLLEDKLPHKYFSLKNLLLACGFLHRDISFSNHLLINKRFTDEFQKDVIQRISLQKNEKRKINIDQLKKNLAEKEKAGKDAEIFVLNYERSRLKGHKNIE